MRPHIFEVKMSPLQILILTQDSYLKIGLSFLIKELIGQVPVRISDGVDLFDEQLFGMCDCFIINDRVTWDILNHPLIKKYENSRERNRIIILSAEINEFKKSLEHILLNSMRQKIFFNNMKGSHNIKKLTAKECGILSSLISGKKIITIAKDFNCSTKTVYAHKYHILEKLGFSSINHLILFLNNTENYKNIGKPLQ